MTGLFPERRAHFWRITWVQTPHFKQTDNSVSIARCLYVWTERTHDNHFSAIRWVNASRSPPNRLPQMRRLMGGLVWTLLLGYCSRSNLLNRARTRILTTIKLTYRWPTHWTGPMITDDWKQICPFVFNSGCDSVCDFIRNQPSHRSFRYDLSALSVLDWISLG